MSTWTVQGPDQAEADVHASLCRGSFTPHINKNKMGPEFGSGDFKHLYLKKMG